MVLKRTFRTDVIIAYGMMSAGEIIEIEYYVKIN
jgi:hypothetical protein